MMKAAGVFKGLTIIFAAAGLALALPAGAGAEAGAGRDGARDFDFEFGAWDAHIRRLSAPLSGGGEWIDYVGSSVVREVWGGRANLGELNVAGGSGAIEGLSLRLYDPEARQWRIHWASSRNGHVGEAMVGGFDGAGRGEFHNREMFAGREVMVRFIFSDITDTTFRLEQAFSEDEGATWEANWIATFRKR